MQNTLIYLCMSLRKHAYIQTNINKMRNAVFVCDKKQTAASEVNIERSIYSHITTLLARKAKKPKKNIVFSQDNSGDTHLFQMAQRRSISPLACHAHFLQRHYFHKNKKRVNKSNKKKECTLQKRKLSWRHTSTILLSCRSVLRFSFSSILE